MAVETLCKDTLTKERRDATIACEGKVGERGGRMARSDCKFRAHHAFTRLVKGY